MFATGMERFKLPIVVLYCGLSYDNKYNELKILNVALWSNKTNTERLTNSRPQTKTMSLSIKYMICIYIYTKSDCDTYVYNIRMEYTITLFITTLSFNAFKTNKLNRAAFDM
ncbi:hypothetical protein V1478_010133 [Vespula squamosa]|uniref:Uncharacterized protein n=1 Tax=Vespula squamosa TaxID=30214 RepID=A0ABD2AIU3_VESSQ